MTWGVYELVSNEPLTVDPNTCPYCHVELGKPRAVAQTAVGGAPGVNHVHEEYDCWCGKRFWRENKRGRVWYTALDGKLLRGVAGCYESYVYTCKCGGNVTRKDHGNGHFSLPYNSWPRYEFMCDACGCAVMVAHDKDPSDVVTAGSTAPKR